MSRYRSQNRYRRNPAPKGRLRWGPRRLDYQTSILTYERRMCEDEWGSLVDPRFGSYDTHDDKSNPNYLNGE